MKNYYEILEVSETASQEVIQKIYKILAKKYHPDLQEGSEAMASAEKFKEIAEAYETLSNDNKRAEYDIKLKEYKDSQTSATVSLEDFQELRDYCVQLENELSTFKQYSSDLNSQDDETLEQTRQSAYEDAVKKAYHDTYINSLKNMGYKIRYKKTFKETVKNIIALFLTIIILSILGLIIWNIPSLKQYIVSTFSILK